MKHYEGVNIVLLKDRDFPSVHAIRLSVVGRGFRSLGLPKDEIRSLLMKAAATATESDAYKAETWMAENARYIDRLLETMRH